MKQIIYKVINENKVIRDISFEDKKLLFNKKLLKIILADIKDLNHK